MEKDILYIADSPAENTPNTSKKLTQMSSQAQKLQSMKV